MNTRFLETIREICGMQKFHSLYLGRTENEAILSSSKNLTFWMTLQKPNKKGISIFFTRISNIILFAVVINGP